jgi:colicin import membrane protein
LAKAESAVEAAKEGEGRALEAQAKADSEADELSQGWADMEAREAHALSQVTWAKDHADAAQKAREAAEAKAAQAGAAARSESESAKNSVLQAERKLSEQNSLLDSLRQELLDAEVARAEDAARSRAEIDQLNNGLAPPRTRPLCKSSAIRTGW